MRSLMQKQLDWAYLFWMARVHAMVPLLCWYIDVTCRDALPTAILNQLRKHFRHNARNNLFVTRELLRILDLFEEYGIEAIPYKGPVLASSVYGNLALRQFVDLDFLIQKQDALKARDLLLSQGYRPENPLATEKEVSYLRSERELVFIRNDGRVFLDIHWQIVPQYFSFRLDHQRLWKNLEAISLGGRKIMTFSPEDLLMILCVHNGGKHHWERLGWICDVARLIEVHKSLDWGRVIEQAGALGAERILFLGLYLANSLLGASLPEAVSKRVFLDRAVESLAQRIHARLFQNSQDSSGLVERSLFHLKMRERVRDRVNCFLRMATVPTVGDLMFLPLPQSLFLLYYLLRPIRLAGRLGLGLFDPKVSVPFVPTPVEVVERMLEMAAVRPGDVVYDLGCGDGRIVIMAAKRYGAHGVGVDIDPHRIKESEANARSEGVDQLVTFWQKDARKIDFSGASVVMLYLPRSMNLKLKNTIQRELQPGARIVSHEYEIGNWPPVKTEIVLDAIGTSHMIFMWKIHKSSNPD
ncbi:MAG: nucleotidyltransferase family protein [Candidatus Neomarinimicrobiota bacterium]